MTLVPQDSVLAVSLYTVKPLVNPRRPSRYVRRSSIVFPLNRFYRFDFEEVRIRSPKEGLYIPKRLLNPDGEREPYQECVQVVKQDGYNRIVIRRMPFNLVCRRPAVREQPFIATRRAYVNGSCRLRAEDAL